MLASSSIKTNHLHIITITSRHQRQNNSKKRKFSNSAIINQSTNRLIVTSIVEKKRWSVNPSKQKINNMPRFGPGILQKQTTRREEKIKCQKRPFSTSSIHYYNAHYQQKRKVRKKERRKRKSKNNSVRYGAVQNAQVAPAKSLETADQAALSSSTVVGTTAPAK